MIEFNVEQELTSTCGASIKVMGVGGAGGNAINSMIQVGDVEEVTYIIANTDAQALNLSQAQEKIQSLVRNLRLLRLIDQNLLLISVRVAFTHILKGLLQSVQVK